MVSGLPKLAFKLAFKRLQGCLDVSNCDHLRKNNICLSFKQLRKIVFFSVVLFLVEVFPKGIRDRIDDFFPPRSLFGFSQDSWYIGRPVNRVKSVTWSLHRLGNRPRSLCPLHCTLTTITIFNNKKKLCRCVNNYSHDIHTNTYTYKRVGCCMIRK